MLWDAMSLAAFLSDPAAWVLGTSMAGASLDLDEQGRNLVVYLAKVRAAATCLD